MQKGDWRGYSKHREPCRQGTERRSVCLQRWGGDSEKQSWDHRLRRDHVRLQGAES